MTLRTPASINNRLSLLDLNRGKERMAITQRELSTGKRLNSPADDPAGAALVVDFNASIGANEQFIKQIDGALSFLQGSEAALTSVVDHLTRVIELGAQALPGNSYGAGISAMAKEVDTLRSTFIALGNTNQQGRYLFSGTSTLTQPFSGPAAGPITYAGNSGLIPLDVAKATTVDSNIPGDSVFFGPGGQGSATDLFQQVTDLRDAMTAGNSAAVQTAHTNLKAILSRLTSVLADLGGRQAGITSMKDDFSGYNLVLQGIQNSIQDTDYPDAVTRYNADQVAQQVTLNSMSKVQKQTLLDFMG